MPITGPCAHTSETLLVYIYRESLISANKVGKRSPRHSCLCQGSVPRGPSAALEGEGKDAVAPGTTKQLGKSPSVHRQCQIWAKQGRGWRALETIRDILGVCWRGLEGNSHTRPHPNPILSVGGTSRPWRRWDHRRGCRRRPPMENTQRAPRVQQSALLKLRCYTAPETGVVYPEEAKGLTGTQGSSRVGVANSLGASLCYTGHGCFPHSCHRTNESFRMTASYTFSMKWLTLRKHTREGPVWLDSSATLLLITASAATLLPKGRRMSAGHVKVVAFKVSDISTAGSKYEKRKSSRQRQGLCRPLDPLPSTLPT